MSEQQNVQLVQQFYAAFKRGDITGLLNTLADDEGWFVPGPKTSFHLSGSAKATSKSPSLSQNLPRRRTQSNLSLENS